MTHLCLYVDDILITSSNTNYIKFIENKLTEKFDELTFHYGKVHQYLGMELNFLVPGEVNITMKNKINQLLDDFNITNIVTTPATNNLFLHNNKLPLLNDNDQKLLRSGVAKLLYLSINTRMDIALPVNYLCTRADKYTGDDKKRFIRILEYLNGTVQA